MQESNLPGAALPKPAMSKPLVSINCITFNHEAYLRSALDGFLMQKTDFPFEILLHDDASTDKTPDIIREYARRYPTVIRPMYQTENQYSRGVSNVSGRFNFPRARGKYIAMCEGDDYWTDPDKLQLQVDYMEQHPDCALCFHSAGVQVEDGSLTESRVRPYQRNRIVAPEEIIAKKSGYATASLLFPTEYVRCLPDYYVNCPVGDTPLQLLLATYGYGYYFDRDMCVYRVGVSVSWTAESKRGNYIEKQKKYFEEMKASYQVFNRETAGRFAPAVEEAIKRLHFLTMVNTRQYKEVMKPENRQFYQELTARTRFFIRFEIIAPGLYRWLQNWLHWLRD